MKDKKVDEEDFLKCLLVGVACAFIFNLLFVGLISISVRLIITVAGLLAWGIFLSTREKRRAHENK